jgi:ATP-dependent RNA helicase RhlE
MSENRPTRSKGAFATFGLCNNLLRAIEDAGFTEPRPIQSKSIAQVLNGRDVLGLAQTGTGKTAAFALPIIEQLLANRGQNPRALILAPTRELAIQIHSEILMLAKYTNIRAITIFGGVNAAPQVRELRKRPDIIVACPGRLLDLMSSRDVNLDGIEVLVLDEADHMLDMGFIPDIKRIVARMPRDRQNLLFSATMPREIRSLTSGMLRDPHVVELAHAAPLETIEHALYPVDHPDKTALLKHILKHDNFTSAIVFLRTKHRARRLAEVLSKAGINAIALQGNMSQSQRQRAMQGFRDGRYEVLVATDIAARGIDVPNVSHVINFDLPNTPEAYTHRIGRTGRSEQNGKACTFVTKEDFPGIKAIEKKLCMDIPRIKIRDFERDEGADFSRGRRSPGQGRPGKKGGQSSGRGRHGSSNNRSSAPKAGGRGRSSQGSSSSAPARQSSSAPARQASSSSFGQGVDKGKSQGERGSSGQQRKRTQGAKGQAFASGVSSDGGGQSRKPRLGRTRTRRG